LEVLGSLTPLPLYPLDYSPQYPFDRRLVGDRAGMNSMEKEKNILRLLTIEHWPSSQ
jgi:hypothetical protein